MSVSISVEATSGLQEAIHGLSKTYRKRMRHRRSSAFNERSEPMPIMTPRDSHISMTSITTPRNRKTSSSSSLTREIETPSAEGPSRNSVRDAPIVGGDPVPIANPMAVIRASVRWRRSRADKIRPYVKFRRAARAVMLIQRVCRVCKDLVYEAVCSEEWYAKVETFVESSSPAGLSNHPKRVRPFRTLVPNEKKELIQLTFDRSEFFKERRVDLTDEMRDLLNKKTSERTHEQSNEVLRFLKRASPHFNSFPLETQRQMVQCMWFDTYMKDRVITKQGSQADSIFFVLSGKLVEKAKDRKQLREIKQGEGFGEEDLKCACPRRTTVLTQTTVELITIHRQDYRAILNMCDDSHDPRYLDICKQDLVFQHFPLHKLIDNPAVWTVLSYKFGCLMVKDSNEMEWIYIIKSGEARVIKHLAAADFNLRARRKVIEQRRNQESPYFRRRQIVDFVADADTSQKRQMSLTSAPVGLTLAQQRRRRIGVMSNVGGRFPSSEFDDCSVPEVSSRTTPLAASAGVARRPDPMTHPAGLELDDEDELSPKVRPHTTMSMRKPGVARASRATRPTTGGLMGKVPVEIRIEDIDGNLHPATSTPKGNAPITSGGVSGAGRTVPASAPSSSILSTLESPTRGRYMSTSLRSSSREGSEERLAVKLPVVGSSSASTPRTAMSAKPKNALMVKVPPFVQLEALNPGRVFGLRSCLEPQERGPSASLVSGGCEVLQINKKFFMKHADEALISLIRLKYKAFPSEEELVDRLDVNIRWEEYKQSTVLDFLRVRGRDAKGYNTAFVSVS